jgi:hypothetical protein
LLGNKNEHGEGNGRHEHDNQSEYNGSESGGSGRGSIAGWVGASTRSASVFGEEALDRDTGGTVAIRVATRPAGLEPFGSLRHAPRRNSWSPAMRDKWVAQMSPGVL